MIDNLKNINSYQDVDNLVFKLNNNKLINIRFSSNNIKHYLFSKLHESPETYNIINCNSGIERFYEDYQLEGIKVFDNLNLCKDLDILKIVNNTKGILIW
jgi:hypothetical protein